MSVLQTGIDHHSAGRLAEATEAYRSLLLENPNNADALHLLGVAYYQSNNPAAAAQLIEKAVHINANNPDYFNNLGLALKALAQVNKAIASFRQGILIDPEHSGLHNNLGLALISCNDIKGAITSYQTAAILNPNNSGAYNNLGNAYLLINLPAKAVSFFEQAVNIDNTNSNIWSNMATALNASNRYAEGLASYQFALALSPNAPEILTGLGVTLTTIGRTAEATQYFRKSLTLQPSPENYSNYLLSLTYKIDCSAEQYRIEAEELGAALEKKIQPYDQWEVNDTDVIRVGFVSGDFREHAVGYFIESVINNINPTRIEMIAYMTSPLEDKLTLRLKQRFSEWHSLVSISDTEAAAQIYANRLHVLVDLSGHTAHNRLPIFAWKPAPRQVSWLGYFASTGLSSIDYVLVDPISVPKADSSHFTEDLWYLPETRMCFTPPTRAPVTSLPAVRNGFITFASFQNLAKINTNVLNSWSSILNALPTAQLRIQCKQMACNETKAQFSATLIQHNIDLTRVTLLGPVTRAEYLEAYAEVDICLDTFPFPGGTTTCEALWMGVPTLSLAGNSMLAKQGASILGNAGLHDWVASTETEYVKLAIHHAYHITDLKLLRKKLREQVASCPIFDARRFSEQLELAFHAIWQSFNLSLH